MPSDAKIRESASGEITIVWIACLLFIKHVLSCAKSLAVRAALFTTRHTSIAVCAISAAITINGFGPSGIGDVKRVRLRRITPLIAITAFVIHITSGAVVRRGTRRASLRVDHRRRKPGHDSLPWQSTSILINNYSTRRDRSKRWQGCQQVSARMIVGLLLRIMSIEYQILVLWSKNLFTFFC